MMSRELLSAHDQLVAAFLANDHNGHGLFVRVDVEEHAVFAQQT